MSLAELRKSLTAKKKIIFGSKRCIKELSRGRVKCIFLTSDAGEIKNKIEEYAKLSKVKVDIINLNKTKKEVQEVTKKPFAASVITVMR